MITAFSQDKSLLRSDAFSLEKIQNPEELVEYEDGLILLEFSLREDGWDFFFKKNKSGDERKLLQERLEQIIYLGQSLKKAQQRNPGMTLDYWVELQKYQKNFEQFWPIPT